MLQIGLFIMVISFMIFFTAEFIKNHTADRIWKKYDKTKSYEHNKAIYDAWLEAMDSIGRVSTYSIISAAVCFVIVILSLVFTIDINSLSR